MQMYILHKEINELNQQNVAKTLMNGENASI